ncbi:DNA topoisomerase III [Candidatus Geothermarchaeota archaeon]|nr:MAG: DNA topoisomerase III [Candidatus Geothermarchaeota archaeon]
MEKYVVVAEKPSVARNLRRFFEYIDVDAIVSSTRGHVMNIDFPKELEWGNVDPSRLFESVDKIIFIVRDRRVFRELVNLFKRNLNRVLVIATDNDSEGELIGYEILKIYRDATGKDGRYYRMRFNSLDFRELKRSWLNKEVGLSWNLVNKALFRAYFDLVTGAAFTRLFTEEARKFKRVRLISWGSCQTPTLYFVVDRERARKSFKREKYWYIDVLFEYNGKMFHAKTINFKDGRYAKELYKIISGSKYGVVSNYHAEKFVDKRPLPLMTDYMLRDLTKITGKGSAYILNVAEELYSRGYISYPRTETDKYPKDFDFNYPLQAVLKSFLSDSIALYIRPTPNPRQGRHDDKAHPPIYPIKPYPGEDSIYRVVWEYIARRYVANVYSEDAFGFRQKIEILVEDIPIYANGFYYGKYGFYKVYNYFMPKESPLPRLSVGDKLLIKEVDLKIGYTKPPDRLSEADLLLLMEKNGIGTDATRALYPRLIIDRNYAAKQRGRFIPTILGMKFIEALEGIDKRLVTPDTRRYVEDLMNKVGEGKVSLDEALNISLNEYKKLFIEALHKKDVITQHLYEGLSNES